MLAGIGSVFVFLIVLVVATRVMSWALLRFADADQPSLDELPDGPTPAHLAVISAVVNRYRKANRKEK